MTLAAAERSLTDLVASVGGPVVVLATSKDPNAKLSVLLFAPDGREPVRVAKIPTTDGAAARIDAEAGVLRRLALLSLGTTRPTVPAVIEVVTHRDRPVLVTTAMGGQPMLTSYHAWGHTRRQGRVSADFAAAEDWLAGLWQETGDGWMDLTGVLRSAAAAATGRASECGWPPPDPIGLDRIGARLASVRTPRTVVHGDFWPGNLLVDGGRVTGVVDWEAARLSGSPVHDMARFAMAYSLYLDRHTTPGKVVAGHPDLRAGEWGAGIAYALDGHGWYPHLVRSFLERNLQRLGIACAHWRDIVLVELLVVVGEADDDGFAHEHLMAYHRLSTARIE